MLYQYYRMASVAEGSYDAADRRRALRVECRDWLVEDQQLRFHREDPGDREPLELPAGQGGGLAAGQVRQADRGQGPARPRDHLIPRQAQVRGTGGGVVEHQALHHLGLGIL